MSTYIFAGKEGVVLFNPQNNAVNFVDLNDLVELQEATCCARDLKAKAEMEKTDGKEFIWYNGK